MAESPLWADKARDRLRSERPRCDRNEESQIRRRPDERRARVDGNPRSGCVGCVGCVGCIGPRARRSDLRGARGGLDLRRTSRFGCGLEARVDRRRCVVLARARGGRVRVVALGALRRRRGPRANRPAFQSCPRARRGSLRASTPVAFKRRGVDRERAALRGRLRGRGSRSRLWNDAGHHR